MSSPPNPATTLDQRAIAGTELVSSPYHRDSPRSGDGINVPRLNCGNQSETGGLCLVSSLTHLTPMPKTATKEKIKSRSA